MGGDISFLNPEHLRYTKANIPNTFENGITLESTFDELLQGGLDIDSLPPLEVVREKLWYTPFGFSPNYWVTDGNRRLYLYRKLKVLGAVSTVRIKLSEDGTRQLHPLTEFSTRNDGQIVEISDDPSLMEKMNFKGLKWQETIETRDRMMYKVLMGGAVVCGTLTVLLSLMNRGRIPKFL